MQTAKHYFKIQKTKSKDFLEPAFYYLFLEFKLHFR